MADATTVNVALGPRSYPVVIDRRPLWGVRAGGLAEAVRRVSDADRAVVITDSVVGGLWASDVETALDSAGLDYGRLTFEAGEANKTLSTWQNLVTGLLGLGVDRNTIIVAVGGGVVGDMAGFAAATVLRGVPFIQVPTTLLAMVDSSVGGKTAVNHPAGKNLVGAFHQPSLVFASLPTLRTLPLRQVRAGLGEVVKTAMLGDKALFEHIEHIAEKLSEADPAALASVIARCVEIKAEVVAQDERESGRRAILNVGHTVGHGIEAAMGYGTLLHGEAVALGMIAETRWAVRNGVCTDASLPNRLVRLFARLGLQVDFPKMDATTLQDKMALDKKATADIIVLPVPRGVGDVELVRLPFERLAELVPEAR